MYHPETISGRLRRFAIPGIPAIFLGAFAATGAHAQMSPASVEAAPGLQCTLHPAGSPSSDGLTVFTNNDGIARFHAVRAKHDDAARTLTLDCTDSAGKSTSYPVDLASDETFASRPLDLAKEPGADRPALAGDPLGYTELQLIRAGYGVRPDPIKNPAAYARWLEAASKPARLLPANRPLMHEHTVTSGQDGLWVGSALSGAPAYSWIEATFNVPTAIPGGDQTTSTEITIWAGVGGATTGAGLIQGGIFIRTTPTTATYSSFQEYCCGDPNQTSGGSYSLSPNDQIYTQSWYCNSDGGRNINGGYGCVLVHDLTSGALLSCTSATGSPCASVKANVLCSVSPHTRNCFTLGTSAEFIIENDTPQVSSSSTAFTDFTPTVTMAGSAFSSRTNSASQTISTDPTVTVLTDWTKTTTHIVVALGTTDQTSFTIEPGQPSFAFYCQGPLVTSPPPTPQTRFKWSSTGAGTAPPGPGECAWADRGPRGTEIKAGNRNVISGYLNQAANLPAGKYVALAVYNDPAADNEMVVTQVIGLVTPPFAANPTPP
jgi:peptidase A4-like protein